MLSRRADHQFFLDCRLPGRFVDELERAHPPQNVLLACLGAGEIDHRVVARRRLGQPGQHGELGQRKILHRLAEIGACGGLEAVGALAEVNLVDVELENLVLGEVVLDLHRQHRLGQFARHGLFIRQEEIARHLHGDGGGAFLDAPGQQVRTCRAQHAEGIDAAVRVKALVLGGDDRLLHVFRNFVDSNEGAALFAEFADQGAVRGVDAQRQFGFVVCERLEGGQLGIDQCCCQARQRRADHGEAECDRQGVMPPSGKHPVPFF